MEKILRARACRTKRNIKGQWSARLKEPLKVKEKCGIFREKKSMCKAVKRVEFGKSTSFSDFSFARLNCSDTKVFLLNCSDMNSNRLRLSWSHRVNVQIEPLLFHFPRTSFVVHAYARCFALATYSNSRWRSRKMKIKTKEFSFCFGHFSVSRFPSSFPFPCQVAERFLSVEHTRRGSGTKNSL